MAEKSDKRANAIRAIIDEYSEMLFKLPIESQSFEDLIMETCARHFVSRRTAREYVMTARAKIIYNIKLKERENDNRQGL